MQRLQDFVVQIRVEIAAVDIWLACRSDSIGSEDPWYLRLNMQGLSMSQVIFCFIRLVDLLGCLIKSGFLQVHELSNTLAIKVQSFDISEYTPIEANRSKLHDIGQFEALFERFAEHCNLPSIRPYFRRKCLKVRAQLNVCILMCFELLDLQRKRVLLILFIAWSI
jgi:hypothetical protein